MKKIIFLFVVALISIQCSKENEQNKEENQDPIVGSWQLNVQVEFPQDGDEIVTEYSECRKSGTITFNADGTYENIYFLEIEDECMRRDNRPGLEVISEEWIKTEDGSYIFTVVYDNGNGQETQTTEPSRVTFPDDNKMRLIYDESENENIESYYDEYLKI